MRATGSAGSEQRRRAARTAHSAHSAHRQRVPFAPHRSLTCCFLSHIFDTPYFDDASRRVRRHPRTGPEGLLTCGFVRAHYVRCGRYGRYLDAEMTLVTLVLMGCQAPCRAGQTLSRWRAPMVRRGQATLSADRLSPAGQMSRKRPGSAVTCRDERLMVADLRE